MRTSSRSPRTGLDDKPNGSSVSVPSNAPAIMIGPDGNPARSGGPSLLRNRGRCRGAEVANSDERSCLAEELLKIRIPSRDKSIDQRARGSRRFTWFAQTAVEDRRYEVPRSENE